MYMSQMGVLDHLSSPSFLKVFLFYFITIAFIPEHAFAGITRHYKFEVKPLIELPSYEIFFFIDLFSL